MKIYIVRHGETPWNKKKLIQGQLDIPLNDYGRELAQKTAEGMKDIPFDRAFSSPLSRAADTAKIIVESRGMAVETDNRLKEIHFGGAEGRSILEARQTEGDPIALFFDAPERYVPAPGGENFADVRERGLDFLKKVIVPLEGKCSDVLVVAHACIIRSIISGIAEIPLTKFWKGPPYKNCCTSIVECKGGVLSVLEEAKLYY